MLVYSVAQQVHARNVLIPSIISQVILVLSLVRQIIMYGPLLKLAFHNAYLEHILTILN